MIIKYNGKVIIGLNNRKIVTDSVRKYCKYMIQLSELYNGKYISAPLVINEELTEYGEYKLDSSNSNKTLNDCSTSKSLYDNQCKEILNNKYILAWILKSVIPEYEDVSIEEISDRYIESERQIDKWVLDYSPGSVITGMNTESNSSSDGKRTMDIVFGAYLTKKYGRKKIIVDIEPQSKYYPGYSLTTRGVYYTSRMISSQYGREFTKEQYNNIKKVYSIWICTDPPKAYSNSISKIEFCKKDIIGNIIEAKESYDKICIVKICIGGERYSNQNNYTGVIKLLDVLLASQKTSVEKRKILEEEYGIPITDMLEREVDNMCNVSETIYTHGKEDGMLIGQQDGIAMFAELAQRLKDDNREEELNLAFKNEEIRNELFAEYGIR